MKHWAWGSAVAGVLTATATLVVLWFVALGFFVSGGGLMFAGMIALALGLTASVAVDRSHFDRDGGIIFLWLFLGLVGYVEIMTSRVEEQARRTPMGGPNLPEPGGRYFVTSSPLHFGIGSTGHCLAINVTDQRRGVWWWQPGHSGCRTRSTSSVIPAWNVAIAETAAGEWTARFVLPSKVPEKSANVELRIKDGHAYERRTSQDVRLEERTDLNVPSGIR